MQRALLVALLPLVTAQAIVTPTELPPTAADASPQTQAPANNGLAPVSYSYAYTYTTPTTVWNAPSFPTTAPDAVPACADYETLCPSQDRQTCQDSFGAIYGVTCDHRFSGTVITSFGKHRARDMMGKRYNSGTLDACLGFCDHYDGMSCIGNDFRDGECANYAAVFGTIAEVGKLALWRQSDGNAVGMGM
ncbi:hypothetical protein Slin14017_G052340 [Septoria linicola]|nr:hypothetical protein Slin14017_G052340 [Septoria linicola]